MRLGIFTMTRNAWFVGAHLRIQKQIVKLKGLLAQVTIIGRCNNVILTFIDEEQAFFQVIQKGRNDDIYQVNVGYDYSADYPPEDDVLVVQLLEEKLEAIIKSNDGFREKRQELLQIVSGWTTEAIGA